MLGPRETSDQTYAKVLLVEDDQVFAAVVVEILRSFAVVEWVASGEDALPALAREDWDLLIADVDLPGMSGLDFAREAKRARPLAATLILTAKTSFDTAIGALRADADDFLTKPLDARELTSKVVELVGVAQSRKVARREVVLAVGAHPDDVEIGCGGALLRHATLEDDVNILTLTGGEAGGTVAERLIESQRAADLISARLFHAELADTSLSVSDGGVMIGTIEKVIAEVRPTIVYTHSKHDVHQDHRNVHDATLVAARRVPRVYCYQAPSSSIDFRPTRFVVIDEWIERKLQVIEAYATQVKVRDYLQGDLLRATARYWSRFGSSRYVEPLEVIRDSESQRTPEAIIPSEYQPTAIQANVG